jgi:hypothetical protein
MVIVFFYAVLGGMKGITYTQIAQFCVLIFAYTVPAIFISLQLTGQPVPQLGLGGTLADGSYLLHKLDHILLDLGFQEYTTALRGSTLNMAAFHGISDDWYCRFAACHHPVFYGSHRACCTNICGLGTGIYRDSVYDGTGCCGDGETEYYSNTGARGGTGIADRRTPHLV